LLTRSDLGAGPRVRQQSGVGQLVAEDAVGDSNPLGPAQGDQVRPTGTGADQVHETFLSL
jgi:hypothetical protein